MTICSTCQARAGCVPFQMSQEDERIRRALKQLKRCEIRQGGQMPQKLLFLSRWLPVFWLKR